MDWMYDGMQVHKEDYLLGKKVEKKYDEKADNGNLILFYICKLWALWMIYLPCSEFIEY